MKVDLYEKIGGEATVERLVDEFYSRVVLEPELKDLFPKNLFHVKKRQIEFITEFLGGPALHTKAYGGKIDPVIRHYWFNVNQSSLEAWLKCMSEALTAVGISTMIKRTILSSFREIGIKMIRT